MKQKQRQTPTHRLYCTRIVFDSENKNLHQNSEKCISLSNKRDFLGIPNLKTHRHVLSMNNSKVSTLKNFDVPVHHKTLRQSKLNLLMQNETFQNRDPWLQNTDYGLPLIQKTSPNIHPQRSRDKLNKKKIKKSPIITGEKLRRKLMKMNLDGITCNVKETYEEVKHSQREIFDFFTFLKEKVEKDFVKLNEESKTIDLHKSNLVTVKKKKKTVMKF